KEVCPGTLDRERIERLYGLVRGFDRRSNGVTTVKVTLDDFVTAYRPGIVDSSELIDLALGKLSMRWQLLREVSTRKPPRALAEHPELLAVVDRCRRRIVEVHAQRGADAHGA